MCEFTIHWHFSSSEKCGTEFHFRYSVIRISPIHVAHRPPFSPFHGRFRLELSYASFHGWYFCHVSSWRQNKFGAGGEASAVSNGAKVFPLCCWESKKESSNYFKLKLNHINWFCLKLEVCSWRFAAGWVEQLIAPGHLLILCALVYLVQWRQMQRGKISVAIF